jgi:hypothetical protein
MKAAIAASSSESDNAGGLAGCPFTRRPASSGRSSVLIVPKNRSILPRPCGLAALRPADRRVDECDPQRCRNLRKMHAGEVAAVIDIQHIG